MGERRRARELALQVLFHLEFNPGDPSEAFQFICMNFNPPRSIRAFAMDLVVGVYHNKAVLDQTISKASRNWRIERMSHLDKTILRIAAFEMRFMDDIPPKVSLDEAVELGKKFGNEHSARYINGVLDNIYNRLGGDNG
ncbi:MAG: transcription antitermination factor NusB [Deltaproteobacteria bacterium]|nr:transcription antitermination factor NusB [Deltaproteobacteria bacterium]